MSAVQADFDWVLAHADRRQLQGVTNLAEWIPIIGDNVMAAKRFIKNVCMSYHDDLGITTEVVIPDSTLDVLLECSDCGKLLPSFQQLSLHAFKEHGHIREARNFATTMNSCPVCLRRYPTRTQAVRHLTSSTKCAGYHLHADSLEAAERTKLELVDTLREAQEKKHGAPPTKLRTLMCVSGPLKFEFAHCYEMRPRYDVEDDDIEDDGTCPASSLAVCTERCLICYGMGLCLYDG